jgi:hypothetical protein
MRPNLCGCRAERRQQRAWSASLPLAVR